MDKILEIRKKFNLYLIEDCAQAHGCYYKDKRVGSIGISVVLVFIQVKI